MITQQELRNVEQSDNVFIRALQFERAFQPGTVITYVLQGSAGDTDPYGGALWAAEGRRDAINLALTAWSNVANIVFVESDQAYSGAGSPPANIDWVESLMNLGDGILGQHDLPHAGTMFGEFNVAIGAFEGDSLLPGGLGFSTLMHEIGHGLGLLHPHTEGGDGWDFAFPGVTDPFYSGSLGLNQGVFTVMTYLDGYAEVGLPALNGMGFSAGLGAFDIAAVQHVYGPNMSYHAGNDTYMLPDANVAGTGWASIWDAGGTDTLSAAGSANDAVFDLREATLLNEPGGGGFASRAFGILGGFTIANGVVIENATGGNGDDLFVGNAANNVLNGGAGFDIVDYSHLQVGIAANLATGAASGQGNDTLLGLEGVRGGSGNDVLVAADQTDHVRPTTLFVGGATQGGTGRQDAIDLTPFFDSDGAYSASAPIVSSQYDMATIGVIGRHYVDYFSITIGAAAAGTQIVVDIDATFGFDSLIRLLDSAGNIVAVSDDIAGAIDRGSANYLDSYLVFDVPGNLDGEQTYYIQVGSYVNSTNGTGSIPATASYTLHVAAVTQSSGLAQYHGFLDGGEGDDTLTGGSGRDHLTGGDGVDILVGNEGDDRLEGGRGDDFLYASEGADLLIGGGGDDTYFIRGDAGRDAVIVEHASQGTDRVYSSVDYELGSASVEILVLESGSAAIIAIGNHLANEVTGNENDNILHGGGGNDTLIGGDGIDHFYGGSGDDKFVLDHSSELVFELGGGGGGVDLVSIAADFYLHAFVENLTLLGEGAFFGVGNDLANRITGNSAANLLIAGQGSDQLFGRAGNDVLFGESGDDLLAGSHGIDYLVGGAGNDELSGGLGADALYGGGGSDVLASDWQTGYHGDYNPYASASWRPPPPPDFVTDILVGGAGDDLIYGNSGLGDYDLLYGNEGNDRFYVDTPDDLVFEQAGEGYDIVYADIIGAGYYLYDHIEQLILLDETPFGVGNALDNVMTGSSSSNWLLGGAGADTLNGGGGNDVLFGEAGSDIFLFELGTGGDVVGDFTPGEDLMNLEAFNLAGFAQLQSLFVQDGAVGAIDLGNGDFVVLHNVQMDQLSAADFIL